MFYGLTLNKIRWRLKQIRFFKKYYRDKLQLLFTDKNKNSLLSDLTLTDSVNEFIKNGYIKLESDLNQAYHRVSDEFTQPFINQFYDFESQCEMNAKKIINMSEVQDIINFYFGGEYHLWSITLNYTQKRQSLDFENIESQLWHWDYNDNKTIHLMLYCTDVEENCGPFTFLPINFSKRIKRSKFWIERYTDNQVDEMLGADILSEVSIKAIGKKGDIFVVDPCNLLHKGAVNTEERAVLFVTLTTKTPYEFNKEFDKHFSATNIRIN